MSWIKEMWGIFSRVPLCFHVSVCCVCGSVGCAWFPSIYRAHKLLVLKSRNYYYYSLCSEAMKGTKITKKRRTDQRGRRAAMSVKRWANHDIFLNIFIIILSSLVDFQFFFLLLRLHRFTRPCPYSPCVAWAADAQETIPFRFEWITAATASMHIHMFGARILL